MLVFPLQELSFVNTWNSSDKVSIVWALLVTHLISTYIVLTWNWPWETAYIIYLDSDSATNFNLVLTHVLAHLKTVSPHHIALLNIRNSFSSFQCYSL